MNSTLITQRLADIDVQISPDQSRPLLFLLRMAAPSSGLWSAVWAPLTKHFTVAAFDFQQLEAAKRLDDPGEVFKSASDTCAAIASGLERQSFHVFGWNGGTHVALRCAVDHADRVASLLLLDVFFELPDMRHVEKAVAFKKLLFEQDRRLYAYYWTMAGLSDSFIANHFDQVEAIAKARLENDRFINQNSEAFLRWVRGLRRNWLTSAEWTRITAPVLILATENDRWNAGPSIAMAEAVRDRLPRAELHILKGVGGHFLIEDP
ncbi:MAG: alpha/beta hydrolase, partial [Pseudomonadota bacterium]